ncbi:hypothetical protein HG535_0E01730 [Zygotorulaspora mrakii]|uniref:Phosphotransferase n=1 Tax=Zygotorulaspora mrakii TaxID=42260 RepID=A0A7H9B539_ZYGMR|nr:uncharacterized protein HG535_0E01730 [Zygotorulaspora mrakii]QLG73089.1 hypothetical protein HG535_0E01730 [Zygotorulaspora mrakii]
MASYHTILDELTKSILPKSSIEQIIEELVYECRHCLENSDISMLPNGVIQRTVYYDFYQSCRSSVPILAIDFGGTKLKFAVITMPECILQYQDEFNLESGQVDLKFFDAIIRRIYLSLFEFLRNGKCAEPITVSVTFSFPLTAENEIVTMGKGFHMSEEVKGLNVLSIIDASFQRIFEEFDEPLFTVEMGEIVNDSVAVYLTHRIKNKESSIALVVGTGLNACFELPSSRLPSKKRPKNDNEFTCLNTMINAEAGFLGKKTVNITQFDIVDNPDCDMPLEYVTSGKWLPQALQRILKHYNILGPELDFIDGRWMIDIIEGNQVFERLQIEVSTILLIREIGKILLKRAAFYLVATLISISRLIQQPLSDTLEVGYVGSFLAHSSYYKGQIRKYSNDLIKLRFLADSNLIGSAIKTYLKVFSIKTEACTDK